MIKNKEEVEALEDHTDDLRTKSKQFKKNAYKKRASCC